MFPQVRDPCAHENQLHMYTQLNCLCAQQGPARSCITTQGHFTDRHWLLGLPSYCHTVNTLTPLVRDYLLHMYMYMYMYMQCTCNVSLTPYAQADEWLSAAGI